MTLGRFLRQSLWVCYQALLYITKWTCRAICLRCVILQHCHNSQSSSVSQKVIRLKYGQICYSCSGMFLHLQHVCFLTREIYHWCLTHKYDLTEKMRERIPSVSPKTAALLSNPAGYVAVLRKGLVVSQPSWSTIRLPLWSKLTSSLFCRHF